METKPAFMTTEFWAYVATFAAILIAGAVINGTGDNFTGDEVWLFAAILTVGYMISRGLAKAGDSAPARVDAEDELR